MWRDPQSRSCQDNGKCTQKSLQSNNEMLSFKIVSWLHLEIEAEGADEDPVRARNAEWKNTTHAKHLTFNEKKWQTRQMMKKTRVYMQAARCSFSSSPVRSCWICLGTLRRAAGRCFEGISPYDVPPSWGDPCGIQACRSHLRARSFCPGKPSVV